jgi:bacteriorhodopsin
MLVTGYFGETIYKDQSVLWGVISGLAYFYIVYLVWFGEVAKLATAASPAVAKANKTLGWFVLVGWAIYPIGYMCAPGGWLSGVVSPQDVNLFYNLADAINKIGFGLVVYGIATSESAKA